MFGTRTRLTSGALAALATGGLLLSGGGVAAAATTPAPAPEPHQITLTPEQSARICEERLPELIERIDRLAARIGGDADTRGSTAWLEARIEKARAEHRDAVVDRLQGRIDRRAAKVERLAGAQERVEAFQEEQCS